MIKLEKWPTDYGRGPKRWYWTSGFLCSVPFFQLFLHPITAINVLLRHQVPRD